MKVLRATAFLLIIVGSSLALDWGRTCGPNEVYKRCVGSSCAEHKCHGRERLVCTNDCVNGCFCAPGF
ncbi:von Willebrand factor, putative [Ixodes scapularis]|uniref:von Willebrand factor, putative n=1 Tax=Ixodes scapularis TaxID=6945 RepID=B7QHM1_IXOSC|nr:von Willebrand factor, putative [Ixodes scapularis]|eukprot:XP_002414678.1 von Willebrand factor, putative [Ixodes scapularis]